MKIGLLGYGKMGRAIEQIARDESDEILLRVDEHNAGEIRAEHLQACDVIIEFTQPDAAFGNIAKALEAGVPVVSGTTGWLDRWDEIAELCRRKRGAFFYASNFSLGVNIFQLVNTYLARLMNPHPEYEVKMMETHHIHKLDRPSGTAVDLARNILGELDRKGSWTIDAEPAEEEIRIHSRREGEVPGIHEVVYQSPLDRIVLLHEAYSREGFARGAWTAARWLPGRKGIFGMPDLLGLGAGE